MPVHAPGPVLLTRVALRSARTGRRSVQKRAAAPELITLPWIDILLGLVFFLLSFFDAQGSTCPKRPLELPRARNGVALVPMPVLSVDGERVDVDGVVVAERSLLAGMQEAGLPRLVEELRMLRRNFEVLHPGEAPGDNVLIRAEGGVPYRALRRLIAASAEAGYRGVSFAVEHRRRGGYITP